MSRIKDYYFEDIEHQQQECSGFDGDDGISSVQIEQDQRAANYTAPTELHNQESEF